MKQTPITNELKQQEFLLKEALSTYKKQMNDEYIKLDINPNFDINVFDYIESMRVVPYTLNPNLIEPTTFLYNDYIIELYTKQITSNNKNLIPLLFIGIIGHICNTFRSRTKFYDYLGGKSPFYALLKTNKPVFNIIYPGGSNVLTYESGGFTMYGIPPKPQ